jgi:hypothetical protein
MYSGHEAIDYLARSLNAEYQSDIGASAHWKKMHSSFRFTGYGFEGLQGFGGHSKARGFLLREFEKFLQTRFRRMAGDSFTLLNQLATQITQSVDRAYDLDVLRQVLSISFIKSKMPHLLSDQAIGIVIGDGFATMSKLLVASRSVNKVILVNLTKTLLVDLWYLKLWMGDKIFSENIDLVTNRSELQLALKKQVSNQIGTVVCIQAKDHYLLRDCPGNFAINIASMQEMEPPVIAAYFDDLRFIASNQSLVFYCGNREEKSLPDGTITKFSQYPWSAYDDNVVDELCPWHSQYYSFRPPFFASYHGKHRHRLCILNGF